MSVIRSYLHTTTPRAYKISMTRISLRFVPCNARVYRMLPDGVRRTAEGGGRRRRATEEFRITRVVVFYRDLGPLNVLRSGPFGNFSSAVLGKHLAPRISSARQLTCVRKRNLPETRRIIMYAAVTANVDVFTRFSLLPDGEYTPCPHRDDSENNKFGWVRYLACGHVV